MDRAKPVIGEKSSLAAKSEKLFTALVAVSPFLHLILPQFG
jgi:hypothetical protein